MFFGFALSCNNEGSDTKIYVPNSCFLTPNNIQILMNVRLVLTTVIKSVPTLKAPSPVPVTVDIHCQVMEDHAMVCMVWCIQSIPHTTEPSNTLCVILTILQFQILMNAAHQVPMTVTMSVPTLKAPTPVLATVDILWMMMGNRAIVISLMIDVEGHLPHPMAVSIHQDIPMATQ